MGLGGNDRIAGLDGNDVLCGGEGNDTVFGEAGNDTVYGGEGDDLMVVQVPTLLTVNKNLIRAMQRLKPTVRLKGDNNIEKRMHMFQ